MVQHIPSLIIHELVEIIFIEIFVVMARVVFLFNQSDQRLNTPPCEPDISISPKSFSAIDSDVFWHSGFVKNSEKNLNERIHLSRICSTHRSET